MGSGFGVGPRGFGKTGRPFPPELERLVRRTRALRCDRTQALAAVRRRRAKKL